MRKNVCKSLFAIVLAFALLLPCVLMSASAAPGNYGTRDYIRVGLNYASNSLYSANLTNRVGSGFELGFYDNYGDFYSLGVVGNKNISVCVDDNLLFDPNGGYNVFNTVKGNFYLGAYHVQLPDSYNTFEEAANSAANRSNGFVAFVNGYYVVRFGDYTTLADARNAAGNYAGAKGVGGSSTCFTVCDTSTARILFEYDMSGDAFAVTPYSPYEEGETWFRGYIYKGGFQYTRTTQYNQGGRLAVTNFVDIDDYVAGVIPYELSASWPIEALKAGAVCARSFALSAGNHQTFDVCTSTDCQVYHGVYTGANADNIELAVESTAGVIAYYNGEPIKAVYSAGTGGYTESSTNTWGTNYGYLQAKLDEFDAVADYPGCAWRYVVTSDQVTSMLRAAGKNCGTIVGMAVTKWTEVGNVLEITFVDASGSKYTLSRDSVRLLGNISGVTYMSRRFTITPGSNTGSPATITTVNSETPAPNNNGTTFTVYNGQDLSTQDSLYVMTADGIAQVSGGATCLTSAGEEQLGEANAAGSTVRPVSGEIRMDTSNRVSDLSYSTTWTLNGSGNGHNVGLSQWGARNMANLGYSYEEILEYYFTGIDIY